MDAVEPVSAPTPSSVRDLWLFVVIFLADLVAIGWFVLASVAP